MNATDMSATDTTSIATIPSTSAQVHVHREPPRRSVDVEVLTERWARIAFGVGFPIGALGMAALHLTGIAGPPHAASIIGGAWLAAVAGMLIVGGFARPFLARGTTDSEEGAGDELLRASLVIPAVSLAIFLPTSLHLPIALAIGGVEAFDGWAGTSFVVVGHAHAVLAYLGARRALRLVDGADPRTIMSPAKIYWIVVAVAAVPGVLVFGLPPLLVAVTGVVFRPLLGAMETVIASERMRLAPD